MNIKKAIALSFAALLISAPAAMAQTTHAHYRHHARTHLTMSRAAEASRADAGSLARAQAAAPGLHYYEPEAGTVWSFYSGYADH